MTEILLENLLKSDFTFGFELEGCASGDTYDGYNNEPSGYYDDDDEYVGSGYDLETDYDYQANGDLARAIDNNLNQLFNIVGKEGEYLEGNMDSDVSIDPDDEYYDHTFEWASPVLECTPLNFKRVINMLDKLPSIGVYTNDSCGFHHHLSWKNITERDMIWVYVNLCVDKDFRNFMSSIDGINLTSHRWSPTQALEDIRDGVMDKDYKRILKQLSDDKYRLFRIHPYGTIEWRGPRDFLNDNNTQIIKDFYYKFNQYINQVIKYHSMEHIVGTNITRKEFFDNLTIAKEQDTSDDDRELEFLVRTHGYHDRPLQYKTERGAIVSKRLLNAIRINPELLYDLIIDEKPAVIPILKNGGYTVENAIKELHKQGIMNPEEFAKKAFELTLKATNSNIMQTLEAIGPFSEYIDDIFNLLKNKFGDDSKSLYRLFKYVVTEGIAIEFKDLYNMIVQLKDYSYISDDLHYAMSYSKSRYTVEEQKMLLILCFKLWFKFNEKHPYVSGGRVSNILQSIEPSEVNTWNNRLISGLFEKPELYWMADFIIDNESLDIKALVALVSRYGDQIFLSLPPSINSKIKKYVYGE